MLLFHRKVRVRFFGNGGELYVGRGGETGKQIYIHFIVEKSISSKANDATIRIHNLSPSSRNSIGTEFTNVEIEAGYIPPGGTDTTGIIFSGQIRDFEHTREGPNLITTVTAGDGDMAIRKATISKTYPAGTMPDAVVTDIFEQFAGHGVEQGEWIFPPMEPFVRPYSICGPCSREANVLGRGKGFYWNIQNNFLEIIPRDLYLPIPTLVNSRTGMIGFPKITDNGIRVTSLINPEIRANRLIKVESEIIKLNSQSGEYRVGRMDYRGDNRSGPFEVVVHGELKKPNDAIDEGIS